MYDKKVLDSDFEIAKVNIRVLNSTSWKVHVCLDGTEITIAPKSTVTVSIPKPRKIRAKRTGVFDKLSLPSKGKSVGEHTVFSVRYPSKWQNFTSFIGLAAMFYLVFNHFTTLNLILFLLYLVSIITHMVSALHIQAISEQE